MVLELPGNFVHHPARIQLDLRKLFDARTPPLQHMLPSEEAFAAAMDLLGVTNDTHVVVYDRLGIFSAPRAWWTFSVFGHQK